METIGADLRQMQRTPLAASHVAALRAAGCVFAVGDIRAGSVKRVASRVGEGFVVV